ncbi:hypothetical protein GCM10027615_73120 [Plantactinospora veratri]
MSGPDRDTAGRDTGPPGDPPPVPLVTLHVWRVPPRALPRALTRMAVDRRRLRAVPGVRFGKLLGTGTGTGFGPTDADLTRWAALAVWSDPERAAAFDESPVGRPGGASPWPAPGSTWSRWPAGDGGPESSRSAYPRPGRTAPRRAPRRTGRCWHSPGPGSARCARVPSGGPSRPSPPRCGTHPACWPGSASARRRSAGRGR